MSNPNEWFYPSDSEDETYTALMNDEAEVLFTHDNSQVYLFDKPYEHINHIYFRQEGVWDGYIFNAEEIIQELIGRKFTRVLPARPSRTDLDAYVQFQMSEMDSESFED